MFIQPGGRLVALTAPTTGWRPARTRKLLAFALGATALTAMLLTFSAWRSPAQAFAACGASTPANVTVPDAQDDGVFGDGSPGLGFAPDLAAVSAAVDGNCGMTISLSRHGFSGADWLFDFESVGLFVNTDGNAATGGPAGAERKILVDGNSPGPDAAQLGIWNGSAFVNQALPAPGAGGATRLTFDALGITAPTTVTIRSLAVYYDALGDNEYDFAPDGDNSLSVPVAFSGPVVAPPPAPPAPAPPQTTPRRRCTVPTVKGMKSRKAKQKLTKAGCRSKVVKAPSARVRRGHVIKTSPRAGRKTNARVTLTVSRGRR